MIRLFIYPTIFILCTIVLNVHQISADNLKRMGTVVDIAGATTEVEDLRFGSVQMYREFREAGDHIAFETEGFDVAVPLDHLIKIEAKGKAHTFTYHWAGKEFSLTGSLFSGEFKGKSDFGDITLDASKLRSLKFAQTPKIIDELPKMSNPATLSLANSNTLAVDMLRRWNISYSTSGYLVGGETIGVPYTDIRFLRGESLVTVPFDNIKRIDLIGDEEVSVTLKNGNEAKGTLSSKGGDDITGWKAVSSKGMIFLPKENVKSIEFQNVN